MAFTNLKFLKQRYVPVKSRGADQDVPPGIAPLAVRRGRERSDVELAEVTQQEARVTGAASASDLIATVEQAGYHAELYKYFYISLLQYLIS